MFITVADENVYQKGLTAYDEVRLPHEPIVENYEINQIELLKTVNSNFICPICLDLIQNTMVTECLHRFCSECITNAIYKSKRECPSCRKKLISKRNLRPDPNFDKLIAAVWPDRNVYEQLQKREADKCKQNLQAFQQSIGECLKQQQAINIRQFNSTELLVPIENGQRNYSEAVKKNGRHSSKFQQSAAAEPPSAFSTTLLTSPDSGLGADILPREAKRTKTQSDNDDDDFGDSDDSSNSGLSDESESSLDSSMSDSGEEMQQMELDDDENAVRSEDFESSGTSANDGADEADPFQSPPPRKKAAIIPSNAQQTNGGPSSSKSKPPPPAAFFKWTLPNVAALTKMRPMDEFMREYVRKSRPNGTVTIQLKPFAFEFGTRCIKGNGGGERQIVYQRYRITLPHSTPIGILHRKLTTPEYHPLKRKRDRTFPPLHLFIQSSSKQMIELSHRDTICTVLGLAGRQNFLDYPIMYFI